VRRESNTDGEEQAGGIARAGLFDS